MTTKQFDYYDDDALLNAYLSYQNTKPAPCVLVCPDWTGRNAFADKKADFLAKLGYVGFAVDVYGEGKQGQDNDEKTKLMMPFMQDRARLRQRLLAAFNAAKALPFVDENKIAVIGFCFGGLCALDLARSGANIKAAISFHGLLNAPEGLDVNNITAKMLALHGYDDPMVPPDQMLAFAQEMTSAKADWQIHVYGNTVHAFTNPLANDPDFGTVYNEVTAKRAIQAMENLLQEAF
jgi:dienelactone hydrolase